MKASDRSKPSGKEYNKMNFADRLIELRKGLGLTQEDLADRVGVSRQSVSKWETGESLPDMAKLVQLADVLGVSTDALSGRVPVKETSEAEKNAGSVQKKASGQKASLIAAASAVALTLGICLLAVLTRPHWIDSPDSWAKINKVLLSPIVDSYLIPAACAMFLALTLVKKMRLCLCCLFTLMELLIYGCFRAFNGGLNGGLGTIVLNMSSLLLRVIPVWFAAVTVLGFKEKTPPIWIGGILGSLLYPVLMPLAMTVFYDTQAAITCLNVVSYGTIIIIAGLGIWDLVMASGKKEKKDPADRSADSREAVS